MAQNQDETAELKLKPALCVNNCGLPGNPTTKNMCQSCFKASLALKDPLLPSCSGQEKPRPGPAREPELVVREERKAEEERKVAEVVVRVMNRCAGCRRKVGLTGFRCRCGDLFCAEHRYSDRHACGFDYKAAGREAIARENPVFKAAKIVRF